MALPNYSSADSASQYLSRNQVQRQRKRERRQDRRADARVRRATSGWTDDQQTDPGLPPLVGPQTDPEPLPVLTSPGFQGQYVAPDNSYDHPFYTPNASYARPGEQYYQLPQGSRMQQDYIEQNPAAGFYGKVSQMGYGGLDARSQTVQGMYKDFATGYQAAKAYNNFEGNFQDFMDMQDIPTLLEQMTNQQLGIDNSRFRGRDRWALRGI